MTTYDAAIIGLGAMGSAAAWHLARRGVSVIGFDQFRPPHNLGSSHGESRVIREAYYEDPSYVPLVQRAYELWGELGAATDQTLLRETGALMVSEADGLLVAGALASARQHGIPHEALTAGEIRQRFPAMAARGADGRSARASRRIDARRWSALRRSWSSRPGMAQSCASTRRSSAGRQRIWTMSRRRSRSRRRTARSRRSG